MCDGRTILPIGRASPLWPGNNRLVSGRTRLLPGLGWRIAETFSDRLGFIRVRPGLRYEHRGAVVGELVDRLGDVSQSAMPTMLGRRLEVRPRVPAPG